MENELYRRMELEKTKRGYRNYKLICGKDSFMICFTNDAKLDPVQFGVCYREATNYTTAMMNALNGDLAMKLPRVVKGQDAID